MLRRGLMLLLVPSILLSQSAVLNHCHAHDHGGRPHFHLPYTSADEHCCCGHHHDCDGGPDVGSAFDVDPTCEHDATAVYVTAIGATHVVVDAEDAAEMLQWVALVECDPICVTLELSIRWRPPPLNDVDDDCPLFLSNLALLI